MAILTPPRQPDHLPDDPFSRSSRNGLSWLGRFDFTSSFSRKSSPGFSMGSTPFGFCRCEIGPLNVFTISIPIHPLFAIQRCRLRCSLAHPSIPNRTVPWRCSVTLIWVVLAWIEPLSVQWSRRVGKLLDRDSDSTPDSRPSVIRTHGPQGRRPTEHRCIREPQGAGSGRAIRTAI